MANLKLEAHGLLLIDKPSDCTSHDVVHRVRKLLGQRSVGHCGTLDPMATGLLIILLGQATKLSDYLLGQHKTYQAKVRLGLTSDTLDITGVLSEKVAVDLSQDQLIAAAHSLQGAIELSVPMFSAVKVKGKKLYEYARAEQDVEAPVRIMDFSDIEVLDSTPDSIELKLKTSKGGYIRAWADELGARLKVGGVLESLRRLNSYPFSVDQAIRLEDLETLLSGGGAEALENRPCPSFIPMKQALPHWKGLIIAGKDEKMLMNGQISHELMNRMIVDQKEVNSQLEAKGIRVLSADTGRLLALLEIRPLKGPSIKRVFPKIEAKT